MQPARMAQIRRDYDMGGSDRNPRRDLRPTARGVAASPVRPLAVSPTLFLPPRPLQRRSLLNGDLILHFRRRAQSLEETIFSASGCCYLE
jgi:hypothetical protein